MKSTDRSPAARVAAILGACAAALLTFATATGVHAAEERFVVPAELAPADLDGAFPLTLTTAAGTLDGEIDLVVAADGALTGSATLDGEALAVAGTQRLTSKGGKVALTLTVAGGQVKLSGALAKGRVAGRAKGTGKFASARAFVLDASQAPPLVAILDLVATTDAKGRATIAGQATVAGATIPVTGSGSLAVSRCAISVSGGRLSWKAAGRATYGDGYLADTKSAGFGARGAEQVRVVPVRVDLTEGAVGWSGAYPAAAPVTYDDDGTPVTVDAHPGQVLVFADPGTSVAAATALVAPRGGTVLAAVPAAGEFLVGVAAGGESAFITSVRGSVRLAMPHVQTVYGGVNATILDNCSASHGKDVAASFRDAGGVGAMCRDDAGAEGDPILQETAENLYGAVDDAGGGPVLVNVSSYGRTEWTWLAVMRFFLAAIAALPEARRDQLVVTICIGNENSDRTPGLTALRNDPRLAQVLRDNVLLVGAKPPAGGSRSNRAVGPEVAYMERDDAPRDPSVRGTSFAAPRALAVIQRLVRTKGLSPRQALEAVKLAASRDANGLLTDAGADAAAADVKSLRATIGVPAGGLKFTMVDGGAAPDPQELVLTDVGAAGSSMRCAVTTPATWLELGDDPGVLFLPGNPSASVTVAVDPAGLAGTGTYRTDILIEDPKTTNRRVRVPVTLQVEPAPVASLGITSASIDFTGDTASYHSYRLTVTGTVSGPVGASCDVRLGDLDLVGDSKVFVVAGWVNETRHTGEPKTTTWTLTKNYHTNVAFPRTAFTVRVTARVLYFPKPGSVSLEEIESVEDVQGN